jgi:hypothetical protein
MFAKPINYKWLSGVLFNIVFSLVGITELYELNGKDYGYLSNTVRFFKFVFGLYGPFGIAGCLVFGPFWQTKLHESLFSNFYWAKTSKGL